VHSERPPTHVFILYIHTFGVKGVISSTLMSENLAFLTGGLLLWASSERSQGLMGLIAGQASGEYTVGESFHLCLYSRQGKYRGVFSLLPLLTPGKIYRSLFPPASTHTRKNIQESFPSCLYSHQENYKGVFSLLPLLTPGKIYRSLFPPASTHTRKNIQESCHSSLYSRQGEYRGVFTFLPILTPGKI
jgi:hypothetical protein